MRHIKYPRFTFHYKKKATIFKAKQIKDVSLSGREALVIISSVEDLVGSGANELLEGVFFDDRLAVGFVLKFF